jgi:hypothetical protein
MHGSKTEYIIQHRVQDYWLDYVGDTIESVHRYLDRAQDALKKLKEDRKNTDFRLVRRKHTYKDEILC